MTTSSRYMIMAFGLLAILALASYKFYPNVPKIMDVQIYQEIVKDVAAAKQSGGNISVNSGMYPPLVTAIFYLISKLPWRFEVIWQVILCLTPLAVFLYAAKYLKPRLGLYFIGAALVTLLLLGPELIFARLDLIVAALLFLAWQTFVAKRWSHAGFFLALAVLFKITPVLALPIFFILTPADARKKFWAGLGVGAALAFAVPLLTITPRLTWQTFEALKTYQGSRGVGVDSLWSVLDMSARFQLGGKAQLAYHHFATHNMDLGAITAIVAYILTFAGACFIYWLAWRKKPTANIELYLFPLIIWAITAAPVLSPQYLVWFLPLLLVWFWEKFLTHQTSKLDIAIIGVAVAAAALTQWNFPNHYGQFLEQKTWLPLLLMNLRNFLLLAMAALFAWKLRPWPMKGWRPLVTKLKLSIWRIYPEDPRLQRLLKIIAFAAVIATCFYVTNFKIMDRDFWWHLKAGEIMSQTKHLITTDIFAYTRQSQPYQATHLWLGQLFLFTIWHFGGVAGITIARGLIMLAIILSLLTINRKNLWLGVLVAILAANVMRPYFMDRPQLFSFLIFAVILALTYRLLKNHANWKMIGGLWILQIVWVNTHGAAALLGLVPAGALLLDRAYDYYLRKQTSSKNYWQLRQLAVLLSGLVVALIISPNFFHNFVYLYNLLFDRTAVFINEWQPRAWDNYLSQQWFFWVAAVGLLIWARRHWVFSTVLLAVFGILSRQAFRHEIFFTIAATAVIYDQLLATNVQQWVEWLTRRRILALIGSVVVIALLVNYTQASQIAFSQKDNLFGWGVFNPAVNVYDFLEQSKISGRMFNTYGIGGYLIYKGYPDRQVYIDGRNVDYGFTYMSRTYQAGKDPKQWQKLDDEYNFDYALIDYDAAREKDILPFTHLNSNKAWHLVYLDDWTALYLKNTPANKPIIQRFSYRELTPAKIEFGDFIKETKPNPLLISELKRMAASAQYGTKGKIALAQIYLNDKNSWEEAYQILREVVAVRPYEPRAHELLAAYYLRNKNWRLAAAEYSLALKYAGPDFPNINYSFIGDVMSLANRPLEAFYYHWRGGSLGTIAAKTTSAVPTPPVEPLVSAMPIPSSPPIAGTDKTTQSLISDLLSGMAQEISKRNDNGINLAKQGQLNEAQNEFLEALKIDPGHPQTLNNLGVLAYQRGDKTAAEDYFRQALKRTDDYADGHYNLALVLLDNSSFIEAKSEAAKAKQQGRDTTALEAAIAKAANI